MASRLPRLIELMSRRWVDPELASSDTKERRLAITKAYLVNCLGLTMLVDSRYTSNHIEKQIHHLPRQDAKAVEAAIQLLSELELQHGVAEALRALVDRHPFPDGGLPPKPDFSLEEARARGFKRSAGNLKQEAFALICAGWVSNKEWAAHSGSTRLAEYIRQLREDDGYDVSVDYRQSDTDTKQKYAYYRFFPDAGERAAWEQEQATKEFMRTEALAEQSRLEAKQKMELRVAARRKKSAAVTAFTQRQGILQKSQQLAAVVSARPLAIFKAPATPTPPSTPSAAAMDRIQALQQRLSNPNGQRSGRLK
ncbi:hypothetical protein ABIC83_002413 [Roseateles asaccharophilus]|uniref:hypothetical protein n=1 Tax=Roseateles asaccharophilus TaxID=582607 RepID=UPI00383428FF